MTSLARLLDVDLTRKAKNESEWVVVGCIPHISVLEVLDVPSFKDFCKRQGLSNVSVLVSALFLISNILLREGSSPATLKKKGFAIIDELTLAKLNDPAFDPNP